MKILVTGGAGFIGSNIVDCLIENGHAVVIVDNLSSGKLSNVNKKAKFIKSDIRSDRLETVFKSEKFDIVNHHAAQIDVRKSVSDPVFDAQTNVIGTLNILENCKKYGVKKAIFASSGGTIYGECERVPPDENSKLMPLSPYGVAKLSVEFYLNYYSATFGMETTVLRYANVFGPRQDPHGEAGVVAIFSQKMLNGEDVFIFGDGRQMRDYVYVQDIVRVNVLCVEKKLRPGKHEIFNIGTCIPISVLTLFQKLKRETKYPKDPVFKPARTGELFKSFLDNSKAKRQLKWHPLVDFSNGLRLTVNFFRGALK
jgi:UDP-glucose 4-epimerase